MNETKRFEDDPKLTAYALGELDGDERAEVEAWVRRDAAARAVVEEIRAAAGRLERALAGEAVAEEARERAAADDPYRREKHARVLRFPQIYYVIGGLAAACFAVVVALREPYAPVAEQEKKVYREISLEPLPMQMPVAGDAGDGAGETFANAAPKADVSLQGLVAENREKAMAARGTGPAVVDYYNTLEPPMEQSTTGSYLSKPAAPTGLLAAVKEERREREAARAGGVEAEIEAATQRATLQFGMATSGGGPAERATPPAEEETVMLSAFTVDAPSAGYAAAASIAGSRMKMRSAPMRMDVSAETYAFRRESEFLSARENPLSTFAADVDTASYANVRRLIEGGALPPVDAVRVEEMVNYFPYRYEAPAAAKRGEDGAAPPLAANIEVAAAPWAPEHRLVRIGLKGREVTLAERGAANLVFLLDVSGSMRAANKLPLVKESMKLLLQRLRADDRVAIVTYAAGSGLALASTPVEREGEIRAAIDALAAGGTTNGAMGIQLAYDIAKANFVEGGINRVILCTDGDFNVGVTSEGDLVRLIEEKAKSRVFLTVLGFGMGNLKDSLLQQIADRGNGSYGYVDTRREAEKLLVEQATGTLLTVAKDVKLQVEFNPARVSAYRLIGYEKRLLAKEDFANDKVDAGEIGAGHTVTALYEIVPVGAAEESGGADVEELRYARAGRGVSVPREVADELLTLKVRYQEPEGTESRRLEFPVTDGGAGFADASEDFKFAAAVAAFGMVLRDSEHKGGATFAAVEAWAETGLSHDPGGYRAEFVELVRKARVL